MENNIKLRKFLIGKFIVAILFVGMAQIIVDIISNVLLVPFFEKNLQLDGVLWGLDTKSMYIVAIQIVLILIAKRLFLSYPIISEFLVYNVIPKYFDSLTVEAMFEINERLSSIEVVFYIFKVILFFAVMFFLWLFPYGMAALFFSKKVSKKMDELENERLSQKREAELQRNMLLSDVAHDIKTPITTIAGFSKALLDDTIKEEHRDEYLNSMYAKSMQVSELVTLLFEYVKLDSAGYKMNMEKTDFCELIRNCITGVYADFEERGVELTIDIPDEAIFINADALQLRRAVNNIIINTLKHNPDMTYVEIKLFKRKDMAVLEISDNGVKIEKEMAKYLFDPFVQGDFSRKSGKGTGLGLSITKKIVNMHNGKVILIQYQDAEKRRKTKVFEMSIPILYIK